MEIQSRMTMQGRKTHEQHQRILERKEEGLHHRDAAGRQGAQMEQSGARQSEFLVSRHGMNQESQHNKHNRGGQSGHKPQQHTPDEE